MKKRQVKYMLTVMCMLAASICYSCSTDTNQKGLKSQVLVADLQDEQESPDIKDGLISAESEVEDETQDLFWGETTSLETESVRLYVHICGEVNTPGVYEVEEGSRIFEAVELAGGLTDEAAPDYLNMALETADGMKITIPSRQEAEVHYGYSGSSTEKENSENQWIEVPEEQEKTDNSLGEVTGNGDIAGQRINLNTATREELMTLKGIGDAKARDIIRYRQEHGPFQAIEEFMNISGIKEAAFQKIKDYITV